MPHSALGCLCFPTEHLCFPMIQEGILYSFSHTMWNSHQMYKEAKIYKQSSTALIGESCIAVLDWFNSSYHWIPGIVLDSRIWDPMLKITHNRLKKKSLMVVSVTGTIYSCLCINTLISFWGCCMGSLLRYWASLKLQCKGLLSAWAQ